MKIVIIGSGNVGVVSPAGFAQCGNDVIGIDEDAEGVQLLCKGKIPFYEPELEGLVCRNLKEGRLKFTTRFKEAVKEVGRSSVGHLNGDKPRKVGNS